MAVLVRNESLNKSWYRQILACPDCGAALSFNELIRCEKCEYSVNFTRPTEIKPNNPAPFSFQASRKISSHPSEFLKTVTTSAPEITYKGPSAIRDSRELMSEISNYLGGEGTVLDLGCGPRDQEGPIKYLGYKYVGVDYTNHNADFLADAHALPFKRSAFDCVLSYAVLEHLHNPFIAISEIERVLKPGGIYIGTVSQGEPFHDSYFHHTSWGFIILITSSSNLQIKRLWSSGDTLGSLARMGRYPRIIRLLIRFVHEVHIRSPFLAPRKMKWLPKDKRLDELFRAGSVCFVVQKAK